jgi:high-affinity iron transporter
VCRRLPLGQFFRYSAILIAVLAVVLIGKSVSALQEAGYLPITWFEGGLRIELLGLYPTLQGIAAQVGIALLLAIGFFLSNRSQLAGPTKR